MKLPVGSSGDFKRAPAGSHVAICNMIVDLGMQPGSGMYPQPKRQLYFRFEIPAERVEYEKDGVKKDGPLCIGNIYTASMNEKATLRKHIESWRSKQFTDEQAADFDISAVLGKACLLSVVEKENGGKTYANVAGISGLPKGMTSPKAENPLILYDDDHKENFDKLPEWLQEKVGKQLHNEPRRPAPTQQEQQEQQDPDDDIPW